jgi:nicotinamidase-related amidase
MNDTALILIDLQNDYFEGGANTLVNSLEAVLNAKQVLGIFRKNQWPVFHIQHISISRNATFFLPATKGAEIHPAVSPLVHESQIIKHYPNSFRDTTLLTELRAMNIVKLVICGMMTHMCVDATVRAARDYGFNCKLVGDACATKDLQITDKIIGAEDVHNAFLAALNGFYANVITTSQFLIS